MGGGTADPHTAREGRDAEGKGGEPVRCNTRTKWTSCPQGTYTRTPLRRRRRRRPLGYYIYSESTHAEIKALRVTGIPAWALDCLTISSSSVRANQSAEETIGHLHFQHLIQPNLCGALAACARLVVLLMMRHFAQSTSYVQKTKHPKLSNGYYTTIWVV